LSAPPEYIVRYNIKNHIHQSFSFFFFLLSNDITSPMSIP
jgi:hypothetical protein